MNPESIKARLKKEADSNKKDFNFLLLHYFIERLLYRLSISSYATNFILKGGLLESTVLSASQVQALADLPPKDVLNGQVVRTIAAPLVGLVTVLSGTIRGLVTCLDKIKEQKEKAA